MPTNEGRPSIIEHFDRPGEQLDKRVFNLCVKTERYRCHRERRLRLGAHGKNIAQTVVRGDLAKHERVIHNRPEGVDRPHQDLARRY